MILTEVMKYRDSISKGLLPSISHYIIYTVIETNILCLIKKMGDAGMIFIKLEISIIYLYGDRRDFLLLGLVAI